MIPNKFTNIVELAQQRAIEHPDRVCVIFLEDGENQAVSNGASGSMNYQVNDNLMQHAKKSAIFMHCLPADRNEEVTDSVIDSKQSKVWLQALNRMYIQQSILKYCIG